MSSTNFGSPADERFSFLWAGDRSEKPRETGITYVPGDGPYDVVTDAADLRGLLEYAGAWIDWYKFTSSSISIQPPALVAEKLRLLDEHDVDAFTGGTPLEIAWYDGETDRFLDAVRSIGCSRIEVSSTSVSMPTEEKSALVETAVEMGFDVVAEVGKRTSLEGVTAMSIDAVIAEMEDCLAAGADAVIFESQDVERAFSADGTDEEELENLRTVVDAVGVEHVILEVPFVGDAHTVLRAAGWFVNEFGPGVNLGNVSPQYVSIVEQQRRGVGSHTYPFMADSFRNRS